MTDKAISPTSEAPPDERGGNRYVQPTATAPHLDSTGLSRWLGSSAVDGFDEPRMAARGGFETFAETLANGEVAPIAAVQTHGTKPLVRWN